MAMLLKNLARLLRTIPLEASIRWHGWRAERHHQLRAHHAAELDSDMRKTRELLGSA